MNEFTFADVHPIDSSPDSAKFLDFNQGYNVSNVDQTYLPIAIEPVREPADIGWIGSISNVADFRTILERFTGTTKDPTANWPIYNNPIVPATGKSMYPDAGIRVPSTFELLNFYMNPSTFPDGATKEIVPATPPKLVQDLMDQWTACTAEKPVGCPDSALYKEENTVFTRSYQDYLTDCVDKIPPYLMPVNGTKLPSLVAFLRFVYGWVPFNIPCPQPVLPTADMPPAGSRAPIDYINLQYNYQTSSAPKHWFNPYVRFIHAAPQSALPPPLMHSRSTIRPALSATAAGRCPAG